MTILPKRKQVLQGERRVQQQQQEQQQQQQQQQQQTQQAPSQAAPPSVATPSQLESQSSIASQPQSSGTESRPAVSKKPTRGSVPSSSTAPVAGGSTAGVVGVAAGVAGTSKKKSAKSGEGEPNSDDEYGSAGVRLTSEQLEERFEKRFRKKKGWTIKKMQGDGACLFRAVADQIYGDEDMHGTVRQLCMDYMYKNRDHFSQFVTEDFSDYVNRKRGPYVHGNHPEIQAMAEMFNRPIEVYEYGLEPINTFQPEAGKDNPPIRLSYHGGVHYNSVVDPYGATIGVGLGLAQYYPGLAEKQLMLEASQTSEKHDIEETMMKDKILATDWEATDDQIKEQVARQSYMEWLKDTENKMKEQRNVPCDRDRNSKSKFQHSKSCDGSSADDAPPPPKKSSPPRSPSLLQSSTQKSESDADVVSSASASCSAVSKSSRLDDKLYDNDWGDDSEILARVLAESQREYLESLKKSS